MPPPRDQAAGEGPAAKRSKVATPELFKAFLRLGLTAFGGPAMVAYIRDLAVRDRQWLTAESFRDGVALCQSIPGATAMQAAAYVGLRAGGFAGAGAAYAGFGLPAFGLMLLLSAAYQQTRDLTAVVSAFRGLQVIMVALVANATLNFGRTSVNNWRDLVLALAAAAFLARGGSPILTVCAAAAIGLLLYSGGVEPLSGPPASSRNDRNRAHPAAALTCGLAAGLAVVFVLDRRLFDLSTLMLKVDLFAFGGGFASVPLMLHEVVSVRGWMDTRTFMDGIALGQVTPGPIVITATFVGYQIAGWLGAVVGTLSVFTPSLIILLAVVPFFDRLRHSSLILRGLRGALVSFVGLLLAVSLRFGLAAPWTARSVVISALAFLALRLKVDILWVVLVGAAVAALVL